MFSISSCEDFEVETPVASFTILKAISPTEYEESNTFEVGEDVFIMNTGTGEIFTVYTGDPKHDGSNETYIDDEGIEQMNTGFNIIHPREEVYFKYNYGEAGTYSVKVIAISYEDEGSARLEDVATKEVTIVEAPVP